MGNVAQPLGGALRACTAQGRAVLVPDHGRAALGADRGQHKRHRPLRALFLVHRQNLGDDLPRLLQQHRVANAQVQPVDIVLVMERGGGNRGPGQADGLHNDLGRQHAGTAHLHHNIQHLALFLLRRVFEGHGPAGRFGRAAQGFPLGQGVDFDHRAVHVIGQLSPVLAQPLDALNAVADIVIAGIGHHGKAHGAHSVQGLGVGLVLLAGAVLQIKADDIQLAGGRHLGVQLAHGASGGVAGIGQQRLAFDLPLRVQLLKDRFGHIHLAPDDQPLRRVFNAQGQRAHGAQILRYIFAGHTVAPGSAPDKNAVFILQRHGKPVDLGLHHIVVGRQKACVHPVPEGEKLVVRENVGQTLQGDLMSHRLKLGQGLTAYPLGGRVGGDQLRVQGLQSFEPLHEHVVFIVRYLRRV